MKVPPELRVKMLFFIVLKLTQYFFFLNKDEKLKKIYNYYYKYIIIYYLNYINYKSPIHSILIRYVMSDLIGFISLSIAMDVFPSNLIR